MQTEVIKHIIYPNLVGPDKSFIYLFFNEDKSSIFSSIKFIVLKPWWKPMMGWADKLQRNLIC